MPGCGGAGLGAAGHARPAQRQPPDDAGGSTADSPANRVGKAGSSRISDRQSNIRQTVENQTEALISDSTVEYPTEALIGDSTVEYQTEALIGDRGILAV